MEWNDGSNLDEAYVVVAMLFLSEKERVSS